MKLNLLTIFCACTVLFTASCKKNTIVNPSQNQTGSRKIQFTLYTDKDFSGDNDNIVFKLSMQNASNQPLWDSILPPMKVREIPDFAHKLVIQRTVPGNYNLTLKAGFNYSIENVGYSWYYGVSNAGENYKEIVFNFH
jgi:hypothetical protein